MPACASNMKRQTSAATTVGMAHGRSAATRTSARPRTAVCMISASARPSASSSGTLISRERDGMEQRRRERGSPSRLHEVGRRR